MALRSNSDGREIVISQARLRRALDRAIHVFYLSHFILLVVANVPVQIFDSFRLTLSMSRRVSMV